MKKIHISSLKALTFSASALALIVASPSLAQEAEPEEQEEAQAEEEEEQVDITSDASDTQQDQGRITVTGSRIVRDTYSSISPLQVISGVQQREVGAFDPTQILQRSTAASGQQIDATFQGFVLDNGPGSTTINLRGLDADRTLVLLNGRRVSPSGVEGAPANPSINLLPASLIERFDLLLDGASSIYGSDAVAGVANVVLRKDFDGLELFARGELNPEGAGEDFTVSAAWGFSTDRAVFGIAAEYDFREAVRLRDRDFFTGCATQRELTSTGEIRTLDIGANARALDQSGGTIGVALDPNDCDQFVGTGAIIIDNTFSGALFNQPNEGNFGLPGFSETTDAFGNVVDSDGDGIRDVDFQFNNLDGTNLDQVFVSEQELYNVYAYGEYTFPGEANITPYFEANFTRAEVTADNTGNSQLSPVVPANNPFNICNPNQPNGFDCGVLENEFLGLLPGTGLEGFANPPGEARDVRNFFSISGDRDNVATVQEQYRGVLGVRGDLPFFGPSWSFDVYGLYTRSEGTSVRVGVRDDRLALALGYDPTLDPVLTSFGNTELPDGPCGDPAGFANPANAQPDLVDGCVPVNLFGANIYDIPFGSFDTQAEQDYLFDERNFDTTYEQIVLSGVVTGDLFQLPGGPVGVAIGAEWREDTINSIPDAVAAEGLFFGFFADQGAVGSKWIRELYGEISLPLIAGKPLVEELTIDLSGRVTDEEFYGTNFTYSLKGGWRPISPLLLRVTYGTSFRAPNLRENFLLGQTGFLVLTDPCAVPDEAFQALNGGYIAELDQRDPQTLENCIREGRDPTRVGINADATNTDQSQSVEILSGGSLDIDPETSTSLSAGFSFEETFGDGYDIALGFTYYDIQLRDSIVEPSAQFIVNDCFTRQDGQRSPFCDRITTDTDAANTRLLVSDVNSGFINLNEEAVRGIDLNGSISKDVALFGTSVTLGVDMIANHLIERSTTFVDDFGQESFDDDAGELNFPEWTFFTTFRAEVSDFLFTYQIRYVGPVEQDEAGIDPFSDAFGNNELGEPTGFLGDTCTGNGTEFVEGDGVFCRDVGFIDEIFYHTASVRYRSGDLTLIVGVDNLFDTAPPLVDPNEAIQISNAFIGGAYDYDGREFFASVQFAF